MLVGRWPSGAPILRVPGADNPALGDDDFANNHFIFDDDARPSSLNPIPGYPGDTYPQAAADFLAQVCPHFAHIRKVHPRDTATEMGKPADSFARLILRRGIPYGPQLVGVKHPKREADRAGSRADVPVLRRQHRGPVRVPAAAVVELRPRSRTSADSIPSSARTAAKDRGYGSSTSRLRPASVRIKMKDEWVTPTGGGYFFAPSISAIRDVLAA